MIWYDVVPGHYWQQCPCDRCTNARAAAFGAQMAQQTMNGQDAERYRWARRRNPQALTQIAWTVPETRKFSDPDSALDAAMRAQPNALDISVPS